MDGDEAVRLAEQILEEAMSREYILVAARPEDYNNPLLKSFESSIPQGSVRIANTIGYSGSFEENIRRKFREEDKRYLQIYRINNPGIGSHDLNYTYFTVTEKSAIEGLGNHLLYSVIVEGLRRDGVISQTVHNKISIEDTSNKILELRKATTTDELFKLLEKDEWRNFRREVTETNTFTELGIAIFGEGFYQRFKRVLSREETCTLKLTLGIQTPSGTYTFEKKLGLPIKLDFG